MSTPELANRTYRLTANFTLSEMQCPCCKFGNIMQDLADSLQRVRDIIKRPMIITSGFRCSAHNKAVGGSDNSGHLIGRAVDIKCTNSRHRYILLKELMKEFCRIGVRSNFIHVDNMIEGKNQDVCWGY